MYNNLLDEDYLDKSIEMAKVELVRYTDKGRLNLARNAAIYLGKEDFDNIRRPLSIIRRGHTLEIFRGEFAEFKFNGVSKEVYDHLTTYTTRNMRVTGGNRALTSQDYVLPGDKIKDRKLLKDKISKNFDNYIELIKRGETPQVARSAMPIACTMNTFVIQFNFCTLIESFFPQRLWSAGAQSNTKHIAESMFSKLMIADADLWDTVQLYHGEKYLGWKRAYQKLLKTQDGRDKLDEIIKSFGEDKSMWG